MTDPDIHKSQHLLKRLEEEMDFLSSLISQALFTASNVKETWRSIEKLHKNHMQNSKKEE